MALLRLLVPTLVLGVLPGSAPLPVVAPTEARPTDRLAGLRSLFVENRGQEDARVRFQLDGAGVFATDAGFRVSLRDRAGTRQRWGLELGFLDARRVIPEPVRPTSATVSYFRGSASSWRSGLSTSEGIVYRELWPGIDLVAIPAYRGLKYEYHVAPGADPARIAVRFRGATGLHLRDDGSLVASTPAGSVVDRRPVSYQVVGGERVAVSSSFEVEGRTARFRLGPYDPGAPLVIDPAVYVYSGYIGGDDRDGVEDLALDAAGNAYVVGNTESREATFPETVGPDMTANDPPPPANPPGDAFVAKLSPSGVLLYAGYIGGDKREEAFGVAVDPSGAAYVTGDTSSMTFPTTPGAFDTQFNPSGSEDVFVTKVLPDGTGLAYSTFLGGDGFDEARDIAVDGTGAATVAGISQTNAVAFPTTPGSFGTTHQGARDAFVTRLHPTGSTLVYSGLLGGSETERGQGLALAADGSAILVGETSSSEATFPESGGPDLTSNSPPGEFILDAFVARVNPAGTALVHAGYLGGVEADESNAVAIDAAGNAYVVGDTASADFPVLMGPGTVLRDRDRDGFIAKVGPTGSLVYSGFLGGSSLDQVYDVAVDAAGSAAVVGYTLSPDESFALGGGPDPTFNGGGSDGFLVRVDPSGNGLIGGTFVGGAGGDEVHGVAVLSTGDFVVGGETSSKEPFFPLVAGPDLTHNGNLDGFVMRLQITGSCFGKPATRFGTPGDDVFTGTPGADVILGLEGDDTISGLGGADFLCGGPDDDRIVGGGGRDRLRGEGGEDRLFGQAGKDRLVGGGQDDVCNGGPKKDTAKGCEVKKRI